jgi:hypothetical protein
VKLAWVMNLGADEELRRYTSGGRTPALGALDRGVLTQVAARRDVLDALTRGGPIVGLDTVDKGLEGRAFAATPLALAALTAAGAQPCDAPPIDVLARVNHRAFCAALGPTLPAASYVTSLSALEAAWASADWQGPWVVKHPHGYVGRLRHMTQALDAGTRDFARRCLDEAGGVAIEPWVERTADYALHGYIARAGAVFVGEPTAQRCDARGAWRGSSRAHDLEPHEETALRGELERVADALRAAGYFGPFGVDAFRYLRDGRPAFHPRVEINARYTMGWAVGMGDLRPDLG